MTSSDTPPFDSEGRATTPNLRAIRSPEAVAVALKYEPRRDGSDLKGAPKVVAGGRGAIAEQILEVALREGVKVREDADLAELLNAIDVDNEIPVEAFAAVAEILIYVYRANGHMPDDLQGYLDLSPDEGAPAP